jgi:lantibiotic leader peptide-processing serine protease
MRMRHLFVVPALFVLIASALPSRAAGSAGARGSTYLVLYQEAATREAARAAVSKAGGMVIVENAAVGLATVRSANPQFLAAANSEAALVGAARNRPVGFAPTDAQPPRYDVEREEGIVAGRAQATGSAAGDALSGLQWDMRQIRATVDGYYSVQRGIHDVMVGIIDTGIDASHPDLARNFSERLSRNFTHDIPLIDGLCRDEPDRSCSDPPDVDEGGHGTHVAGIVGAELNGLGTAGVAPDVRLVNLRAGQDSGRFFLQQTVNALTYAGDIGVDVVNMSFFTDPWLYNCRDNPADSPEAQREQQVIIAATQRALEYAHAHDVTLVSASGNEFTDLGHPTDDDISPDFPPGAEYHRDVDNSCLTMPTEGRHVIVVNATGPTERKAFYSNYGREQSDVAAPGGDSREFFGTPQYRTVDNLVLSSYPEDLLREEGLIRPDGTPAIPDVVRSCSQGVCAYYAYLQGTSMASPHAAGVAALIVSQYGTADPRHAGLTLAPQEVRRRLEQTSDEHACPRPRLLNYQGLGPIFTAFCAGPKAFNGFFGHGIVNAARAVA